MRAPAKNTVAGMLAALALGIGLAGVGTPAFAGHRGGGGGRGGWHGGWHGGLRYAGWRGYGYGYGYGYGCGYGAWRCGGYWAAPAVVDYVPAPAPEPLVDAAPPAPALAPLAAAYTPAPVAALAPPAQVVANVANPVAAPPAAACGVVFRPLYDASGANVGMQSVNTCR